MDNKYLDRLFTEASKRINEYLKAGIEISFKHRFIEKTFILKKLDMDMMKARVIAPSGKTVTINISSYDIETIQKSMKKIKKKIKKDIKKKGKEIDNSRNKNIKIKELRKQLSNLEKFSLSGVFGILN